MTERRRSGTDGIAFGMVAFFLFGSFIALPVYSFLHFPLGLPVRWSAGIALACGAAGGAFAARSEKGQDLAGWIWDIAVSLAWWT